ncbi:protein draper-like, partial [Mytilus californianus]|uniref:protein draper-like n=1 Tax=Mytilus californianus TaxID=6549 RepID=UPI002246FD1F
YGSFGAQCLRNCSNNCVSPPCNHATGECDRGCIKGWEGFNCTKECSKGKFGFDCSESCDGCINDWCNRFDGICLDNSGCKPGYEYGRYCNTKCNNGYFGFNCRGLCEGCVNVTCERLDGYMVVSYMYQV